RCRIEAHILMVRRNSPTMVSSASSASRTIISLGPRMVVCGAPRSNRSPLAEALARIQWRLFPIIHAVVPQNLRGSNSIIPQDAVSALCHYHAMLFQVAPTCQRLTVAPVGHGNILPRFFHTLEAFG